jgi:hypothetical protein
MTASSETRMHARASRSRASACRCHACGRTPHATVHAVAAQLPQHRRVDAWQILPAATADLDIIWLVPDTADGWREARFCAQCAPAEALWPIECHACSDGPIIVLDAALPGMPVHPGTRRRASAYLHDLGWHADASGDLTCPKCITA